jgi:hypothetical protein
MQAHLYNKKLIQEGLQARDISSITQPCDRMHLDVLDHLALEITNCSQKAYLPTLRDDDEQLNEAISHLKNCCLGSNLIIRCFFYA